MDERPQLLEQTLAAHGDTLYRMALLLGGPESEAAALLRAVAAELLAAPPALPPDEPELLARLAAAARRAEQRAASAHPLRQAQGRKRLPAGLPALYRSILAQPLEQRLALGLYLLAGYDLPRAARVAAVDEAAARAALLAAMGALGPAVGHALTDRVSGETCADLRAALIDPAGRSRHGAAVRGHLAACPLCRSFDQSWGEIAQQADAVLRAVLRERRLPADLEARLAAMARPRRALSPQLRFAIPPLVVLILVAALVLPGFGRRDVTLVDRAEVPPVEPLALIEQALDQHGRPPTYGPAIWHARFETVWYFNNSTYAPLRAELWLDRGNPARHRIQITHSDGGAPYELQIGNGRDRLHYALDATYAPSLYGDIGVGATEQRPLLHSAVLDAPGQERALGERLLSGPWGIPPFYLRQAREAGDLRVLGRQRDGGRSVQILSFSGFSPLGLPPDAPGATAERVTVLLALDAEDGRLRSATEISGPPGGTQTSRITWRLAEEQWPANADQIAAAFSPQQAWNGIGEFPDARHTPADLGAPAIRANQISDPLQILNAWMPAPWLPAAPPPGVDRAILLWDEFRRREQNPPQGAIYLGPGRRLVIVFHTGRWLAGETTRVGDWEVVVEPGRGNRYRLALIRPGRDARSAAGAPMSILAQGFSRDELLAMIADMRPFDLDSLAAQQQLFVTPGGADAAARLPLLAQLIAEARPRGLRYTRAEQFSRQNSSLPRLPDPYHRPVYDGRPELTILETWSRAGPGGPESYSRASDPTTGRELVGYFANGSSGWYYLSSADSLSVWSQNASPLTVLLPPGPQIALDMLLRPGFGLSVERRRDGSLLVSRPEDPQVSDRYQWALTSDNGEPYLGDLRPITLTTELELDPDGAIAAYRLYAEGIQGRASSVRQLVNSYTVLERRELGPAEAPARLDARPAAAYTIDWTREVVQGYPRLPTRPLTDTLERIDFPLYVLPPAAAELSQVEENVGGPILTSAGYTDLTVDAVAQGLAVRLAYQLPPPPESERPTTLHLTQGPAAPLRAFMRSSYQLPWSSSARVPVTIAGREREAWLVEGQLSYLIVELDQTLLIVSSPPGALDPGEIALIAQLQLAK